MTGLGVAAMLGILGILVAVFMAVARPSSCDEFLRIMRTGKVGKYVTALFATLFASTAAVIAVISSSCCPSSPRRTRRT